MNPNYCGISICIAYQSLKYLVNSAFEIFPYFLNFKGN